MQSQCDGNAKVLHDFYLTVLQYVPVKYCVMYFQAVLKTNVGGEEILNFRNLYRAKFNSYVDECGQTSNVD